MAAPNMLSANTINGKTAVLAVTNGALSILSNAASSGKLLKVETLYISNIDSVSRTITISYYSAAALGGTAYKLANAIAVPANTTIAFITKEAPIYLAEDSSLGMLASANTAFEAVLSYEDIS